MYSFILGVRDWCSKPWRAVLSRFNPDEGGAVCVPMVFEGQWGSTKSVGGCVAILKMRCCLGL